MKQKYHLAIDDAERRLLIGSLNDLRSKLITEGRYTDAVDEVLLKTIGESARSSKSYTRNEWWEHDDRV